MTNTDSKHTSLLVVGVIGIFVLLLIAMGYAYWESGTHYQSEQVNQFVIENSAPTK